MVECRILIILGEILEENQKFGFQNEILGGLYSCPSKHLEQMATVAKQLPTASSVTTTTDGHVISRVCDQLSLKVISRPTSAGLARAIATCLKPLPAASSTSSVTLLIIYAGLMAETSAHWVLPSLVFTPTGLVDLIELAIVDMPKQLDAENQHMVKPFHIHVGCTGVPSGGEWRQLVGHRFSNTLGGHPLSVTVNKLHTLAKSKPSASGDAATPPDLSQLIEDLLVELPNPYCQPPGGVVDAPDVAACDFTGLTLQVPKPCLYVFPEGSGQASIFALPGYNLLVNAGCARRPTFLPVAAHLERLDSILLTHWGVDNLLGLSATLPAVFRPLAQPTSGCRESTVCLLAPPPASQLMQSQGHENGPMSVSPFCLNLPRRVSACLGQLRRSGTGVIVHQLTRGAKMEVAPSKPIQLYHKIGHGTLELFILTPSDDDTGEIRKLSDDWSKAAPTLISATVPLAKAANGVKAAVPLLSYTSVSALVIWRPAFEFEPILRLLFVAPVAHQSRVITSLDAMSSAHLYLRHPKATTVAQPTSAEVTDRRRSTAAAVSTVLGPRRPLHPLLPNAPKRASVPGTHPTTTSTATTRGRPAGKDSHTQAGKPSSAASVKRDDPKAKVPQSATAEVKTLGSTPTGHTATKTPSAIVPPTAVASGTNKQQPPVNGGGGGGPLDIAAHQLVSKVLSDASGGGRVGQQQAVVGASGDTCPQLCPPSGLLDQHVEDLHLASRSSAGGGRDPVVTGNLLVADWGAPLGLPAPTGPPQRNPTARTDARSGPAAKPTGASHSATGQTSSSQSQLNSKGYTDASAYATISASSKLPPYDRVKPIYVDVAYLPGGGNCHLVDAEFFKRVRARYYVATDARPSAAMMEALVVGKEAWTGDDAQLSASLVLAHESSEVIPWLSANSGRLSACHLGVDAVASRSGIQLSSQQAATAGGQFQPITCPGYRIDF